MKIRKIGKFIDTAEICYGCMGLRRILGSLNGDLYDQLVR